MVGAAAKLPEKPSRNVWRSMDVLSPDKWYNPTVSRLSRPSASQPQPWSETSLPLSVPVTRAEGSSLSQRYRTPPAVPPRIGATQNRPELHQRPPTLEESRTRATRRVHRSVRDWDRDEMDQGQR